MAEMIPLDVIGTGSSGNATVLNNSVLIDCGMPYKAISPHVDSLRLVLLTHIHSDHFNRATIKRLAHDRPTLRFGCGRWLVPELVNLGVSKTKIDVMVEGMRYTYGTLSIVPVKLTHNVENFGYKLNFNGYRVIYATDTSSLRGIEAKGYDLYLVEANYNEDEIDQRIYEKQKEGKYAYEIAAKKNHLSRTQCDDWLFQNANMNSQYIYMHQHVDRVPG